MNKFEKVASFQLKDQKALEPKIQHKILVSTIYENKNH
jgi:hypothetical protein